jgi:phosphoglycolate phosphatase-like HAD superfamily hydrolase/tRNA(Arg) A34 adenosine deaminase TadA
MALDGVLFDLDGTLVDTNEMHVRAWQRALESRGYKIAADRIWLEVGKGGDKLVPDLLGREADERDGDALREAQPREFEKLAKAERIRPFPRAADLLKEFRRRGLQLALATSSGEGHLKTIETCSGVPWRTLVDATVTADDAANSKPSPDPLAAGLKKLRLSPAQCAMVGDTQYDATASRNAGLVCLGLLCGRNSEQVMRSAGARGIYRDVADLLDHLDDALTLASPGSAHLTQAAMEGLMRQAIEVAAAAIKAGEAPIACLLARGDLTVVATGHNEMNRTQNKAAHAEIVTFARAAGKVPLDARDLILVSTLEPCVMCTGAAMEAAVDTIIYALPAPADSGTQRVACPTSPESQMPRIVGRILKEESQKLFEQFLKQNIRADQRQYVEQLLRANA